MPTVKKAYCFTLNNYSLEEYESIKTVAEREARYCIIGREVGESGTPHLQGYIIFKRSYRFDSIKNRYLPRCHIEVAAGSIIANKRYCSKDGDFWEHGEFNEPKTSSRDELARNFVARMASGQQGLLEFSDEFPGTYYFSGHNLLRNYLTTKPPVERPTIQVRWIFGRPGSGKSRKAHETLKEAYVKEPRTKWWSGYMLEKDVIIDDFGPGGIDINHLLRWFDRYKCLVESKGGMIPLYAENFIVTSNFHPEEIYSHKHMGLRGEESVPHPQLPALLRRIVLEELN